MAPSVTWAASAVVTDGNGTQEPETWDLDTSDLAQTVFGLPAFNPTPAQLHRMEEINACMLNVPNLFCATADQKGVMLSLQSLQVRLRCSKPFLSSIASVRSTSPDLFNK